MEQLQMEQKLNVLCICIFVLVKDSIGLKVLINSNKKQAFHCGGDKGKIRIICTEIGSKEKEEKLLFSKPISDGLVICWLK